MKLLRIPALIAGLAMCGPLGASALAVLPHDSDVIDPPTDTRTPDNPVRPGRDTAAPPDRTPRKPLIPAPEDPSPGPTPIPVPQPDPTP